jgi:hypothetical protein
MDIEKLEIGDIVYLKEAVKGYRRVEIVQFYGRDILIRTESGWEFCVCEDDIEED